MAARAGALYDRSPVYAVRTSGDARPPDPRL